MGVVLYGLVKGFSTVILHLQVYIVSHIGM